MELDIDGDDCSMFGKAQYPFFGVKFFISLINQKVV